MAALTKAILSSVDSPDLPRQSSHLQVLPTQRLFIGLLTAIWTLVLGFKFGNK
jgi:hypothetical protein